MERGGRRRRGRRLRRLRVPACSSRRRGQRRGAGGAERCIPGWQISMRHVGADSLLRSEAAALGVLPARRIAVHPPLSV